MAFCAPVRPEPHELYSVHETYVGSKFIDCIMYNTNEKFSDCNCRIYRLDLVTKKNGVVYKTYYDTVCRKYPVKEVGRPIQ